MTDSKTTAAVWALHDTPTISALVEAVWQVLDDMGEQSASCCLMAKAKLRAAIDPFLTDDLPVVWPMHKALAIIKECEDAR